MDMHIATLGVGFGRLAFAMVSFSLFSYAFGVGSCRSCGGFAPAFLVSRLASGFIFVAVSRLCLFIRMCRTSRNLLN